MKTNKAYETRSGSYRNSKPFFILVLGLAALAVGSASGAEGAWPGGLPEKALSNPPDPRPVHAGCNKSWDLPPVFGGGRGCTEGLVLRTSKSYIDNSSQESYYDLFLFEQKCETYSISNSLYRHLPFDGTAELDIEAFDPGLPGSPSYQQALEDDPWTHHWTGIPVTFNNGFARLAVPTHFGRTAAVMKARPQGSQGEWSNLVQINRQTLWELKPLASYLPGTNASWAFQGMNHPASKAYRSEVGVKSNEAFFHLTPGNMPSTDVDEVMYFLKNKRHGYIISGQPAEWNQCSQIWHTGHANGLWWLKRNVGLAGDTLGERWIVSNASELFTPPGAGTGCNDSSYASNWANENNLRYQNPVFSEAEDLFQCPAQWPASNYRNYIIGPEYLGLGWGIHLEVRRGDSNSTCATGNDWVWIVEANFYADDEVPGLAGASPGEDILQLKFVEARTSILDLHQNPDHVEGGHREDWYLSADGKLLRIEDRMVGPKEDATGPEWIKTRLPAAFDPDIFFRDIMDCPMFTMTNESL